MRILRVHNRYQERGGEDVCFDAEVDLLQTYGEDVQTLIVTNDAIPDKRSLRTSALLAASTVWSRDGYRRVASAIHEHQPDVVHFDNTFPLISSAGYAACRDAGIPVIQTLHNYRLLCPEATFFREGRPCEDCLGKTIPLPGVTHACYRGSRKETAAVAAMIAINRLKGTWTNAVDRYITMTAFEREKFIEGGFPPDRLVIKPHFVKTHQRKQHKERNGLLYVGRLTAAKGLNILMEAWQQTQSMGLTIVGDGPMQDEVAAAAEKYPALHYVGRKSSEEILDLVSQAQILIAPTQMYETFGRVAIEAFAQGTPVLASNIGATGEVVSHGETGLHFEPGNPNDLARNIRWVQEHPDELLRMGKAARNEFESKYTPDKNYHMLMNIYHQAQASAEARHQGALRHTPAITTESR